MINALTQLKASLSDRYDIEREIGAGGMATVYLARDTRHDRPVALKVLNPDLGAVLGVERFLAEIKVTANLQHPNLLPLFDSGEAGGLLFYVMPFVEGESLRVRLEREKQLPIDEALRIAVAIASALDYAHAHGVIHRDLKPENILMQAGQPVIADFGIALAVSKAGGNRITQTGLSLGTPQYMSPEQATGDRVIDGRSDIYSLAAMTYEMLAGEAPHTGTTAQAIIARVLTDKPRAIRSTRSAVPEHVEAALDHALEKLPADRFSTAHEFAEALQGRATLSPRTAVIAATTRGVSPGGWRSRLRDPLVLTLSLVALASIAASAVLARRRPAETTGRAVRFVIASQDSTRPFDNFPWPAAISPDGGTVVYSVGLGLNGSLLYTLRTDQLEARPIPGTNGGYQPLFSPDGQWIEFEAQSKEKKVRLDGSAPVTISDGGGANGADWTVGDEIVLGAQGKFHGLSRVSAAGGEPSQLTTPDTAKGDRDHLWPIAFPDGKTIAFVIWSGTLASARLALTSLDDGKIVPLGLKGIRPLAMIDGALIYLQSDGSVMAVRLDAGKKRVTGKPIPVLDPVPVGAGNNGNSGVFTSRGGALVTSRGGTRGQLVWLDHDGRVQPVMPAAHRFSQPRLSPDGRRIAVVVADDQKNDVWIYDIASTTFSRLTSSGSVLSAEWNKAGTHIVFSAGGESVRTSIYRQLAAGGSPAEKLAEEVDLTAAASISPDERSLVLASLHDNSWDLLRVSIDSNRAPRPYLASPAQEIAPRFSPDGHWVALHSDESGRNEVYVRSFPDPSSRIQISTEGGSEPVWSADGSRLYYRAGTLLLSAKLALTPSFVVQSRDTVLTRAGIPGNGLAANYDVSRDGKRILAPLSSKDDYQLVVVPNWIIELRQRLAASNKK